MLLAAQLPEEERALLAALLRARQENERREGRQAASTWVPGKEYNIVLGGVGGYPLVVIALGGPLGPYLYS